MRPQKVLVISVSGIGNTILQSPLINALLQQAHLHVDVLFANTASQSVYQNDRRIKHTYLLANRLRERIQLIKDLRANQYDYSIACFPSNRMEFHLLAFFVGAKNRISHSYNVAWLKTLSFLSNMQIPADERLNDVKQNLNLLQCLGIQSAQDTVTFSTSTVNTEHAQEFLRRQHFENKNLIGIHPGCKTSEKYRRWPEEKFVELVNLLNQDEKCCLLFAGPDEGDLVINIYHKVDCREKNLIVSGMNVNDVAAIIRHCQQFLSTDSGLGHIAITQDVETYAIFGPAMASRTAPYGKKGHVITANVECCNTYKYPFGATHSRINCPYDFQCLRELSADTVYQQLYS